jgi:hypothetical protein
MQGIITLVNNLNHYANLSFLVDGVPGKQTEYIVSSSASWSSEFSEYCRLT